MNAAYVPLLLVFAVLAANLPFINNRTLGVGPQRKTQAGMGRCLLELLITYLLAGAFGLALEHRAGQIAPQGWEFYAITGSMFLTLAFPGFVYRFLLRR
jgi:Protein of unknown function (DUF2818)